MAKWFKAINIAGLLLVLTVNGLANYLPLNGRSTGEISDLYPVLFTPAAYVFSIWGVIYLFLIGFVIYQAFHRQASNPFLACIGGLFALTCVFNSLWIFAWHYDLISLSVIIMLALLFTLMLIYARLEQVHKPGKRGDRWLVRIPFSIYLAWISVATIANISVALYRAGWTGQPFGPEIWTLIMLAAATLLAAYFIIQKRDILFGLVFVWALVGIGIRQSGIFWVQWVSWIAAMYLLALIIRAIYHRSPSIRPF